MSKESKSLGKQLAKIIAGMFLTTAVATNVCDAEQTGDQKNIYLYGVMVQTTPCAINGDKPITVTFGNVAISKIDTGRYMEDLHYTLNCGGATSNDQSYLTVKATPTSWDTKAIATSVSGLGAQVLKDGSPLELNRDIMLPDPTNPPKLQVLLVKDPTATLTEQPFIASGTLIVEYV